MNDAFNEGVEAGKTWLETNCYGSADTIPPCPYKDEVDKKEWRKGFKLGVVQAQHKHKESKD